MMIILPFSHWPLFLRKSIWKPWFLSRSPGTQLRLNNVLSGMTVMFVGGTAWRKEKIEWKWAPPGCNPNKKTALVWSQVRGSNERGQRTTKLSPESRFCMPSPLIVGHKFERNKMNSMPIFLELSFPVRPSMSFYDVWKCLGRLIIFRNNFCTQGLKPSHHLFSYKKFESVLRIYLRQKGSHSSWRWAAHPRRRCGRSPGRCSSCGDPEAPA